MDEIADKAGVGIATVDRVLNERGGVSPKTAAKVLEAARELETGRILPSPYTRLIRIKLIMPSVETPLNLRIRQAFEDQIGHHTKTLVIERVWIDPNNEDALKGQFRKGNADAIIAYVPETSSAIEAIAATTSSGVPVVTLCSDLPTTPRLGYVGIDHYQAGRAAGFLMSQMARGTQFVGVCSDLNYRAEASRISGFRDGLSLATEGKAKLSLLEGSAWVRSDNDPDVAGIYIAGCDGPLADNLTRWNSHSCITIAHDLGDMDRKLMAEGLISIAIEQNAKEQAIQAIAVLLERFGIENPLATRSSVPFTIHTLHNI